MMKKLKLILLLFVTVASFTACEQDDDLEFVANEAEGLMFNTSFLDNYVLNSSVSSNLAERFTWGSADFGVPTNTTYYLQGATMSDFSDYVAGESLYDLGSTTANPEANEIPVTVGQMIALANAAGLDNNEGTNTGTLYFRLMAVIGDDGLPSYSAIQGLNVELQEESSGGGGAIMPVSWGIVGSGYNDWGNAGPDGTFYSTADADIITTYLTLVDGEIKFRENDTWGGDLGDANGDGVLDADPDNNIAVTAGNYKITLNTSTNEYTIEEFSWGIVGSAWNDWGNAGPDAKMYYDYTTDSFKVGVKLMDGDMKVRFNNNWGGDYGDGNGDGILDQDPDNNIAVTEGHYLLTVNFNDLSYSLEPSTVYGIVGSGYNDWGGAGDDFALTEIQENVFVGDLAPLVDGEIKFRPNNTWSDDFGDAGLDGILDQDPDNNISVTAGNYRVRIDFNDNSYQLNRVN